MVMQHHKAESHAEKLVHCVHCQGHGKGLYNQNMTIPVVSSKLPVVCNQTWFHSRTSEVGVSCWKMGVLHSRTRSQWRFKMLVKVRPDTFWITEHFVTKFGMVMQHHEPKCHAEEKFVLFCYLQDQGHRKGHMIKMWLFLLYFLDCWFLGNQTWSDYTSS